ncbi:hypothetical protein KSP40_PGU005670 [Platanthera guangdongensis]|uniref:Uncharacterized protein n=1 Tax=Platanthera guangdongensis TaxID=2320717 RepID=A0ABR2M8C6_9ASPA
MAEQSSFLVASPPPPPLAFPFPSSNSSSPQTPGNMFSTQSLPAAQDGPPSQSTTSMNSSDTKFNHHVDVLLVIGVAVCVGLFLVAMLFICLWCCETKKSHNSVQNYSDPSGRKGCSPALSPHRLPYIRRPSRCRSATAAAFIVTAAVAVAVDSSVAAVVASVVTVTIFVAQTHIPSHRSTLAPSPAARNPLWEAWACQKHPQFLPRKEDLGERQGGECPASWVLVGQASGESSVSSSTRLLGKWAELLVIGLDNDSTKIDTTTEPAPATSSLPALEIDSAHIIIARPSGSSSMRTTSSSHSGKIGHPIPANSTTCVYLQWASQLPYNASPLLTLPLQCSSLEIELFNSRSPLL